MMRILIQYETEHYVWGRRESVVRRGFVLGAGDSFMAWRAVEEDGAVRFLPEEPLYGHRTAEEFTVHAGETVAFSCTERYECAEDRIEDVTKGTAQLLEDA